MKGQMCFRKCAFGVLLLFVVIFRLSDPAHLWLNKETFYMGVLSALKCQEFYIIHGEEISPNIHIFQMTDS